MNGLYPPSGGKNVLISLFRNNKHHTRSRRRKQQNRKTTHHTHTHTHTHTRNKRKKKQRRKQRTTITRKQRKLYYSINMYYIYKSINFYIARRFGVGQIAQ